MKFKVEDEYIDTRLDKYLRKKFVVNMNDLFKYISNGKIQINFEKVKQNYRLKKDDLIYIKESLNLEEKKNFELSEKEKKMIEDSIIFQDANILIFNKKSDIVMHKGSSHEYGLSEMLKSYFDNETFAFVNRIDKSTSGLIIGSKNIETTRLLSKLISERKVIKKYYILVEGCIEKDFDISSYLLKDNRGVREYSTWVEGSKESRSSFKVLKTLDNYTLLEGILGTGRTHQLRIQLSSIGHSIVGDEKYGRSIDGKMHLFSHEVIIEALGIHINLEVPNWFIKS